MPAQLSFAPCISSVRDEIQRINSRKAAVCALEHSSQVPQDPCGGGGEGRKGAEGGGEDAAVGLLSSLSDSPAEIYSDGEAQSDVSCVSATATGSRCERARKGDIYTMSSDDEVRRIVTEINAGHLVSNTKCAPWGPGSKHNPNHPDTLRVRIQISSGPKTRDQLAAAIPGLPSKLLRAILHELREQGIISMKRCEKKEYTE